LNLPRTGLRSLHECSSNSQDPEGPSTCFGTIDIRLEFWSYCMKLLQILWHIQRWQYRYN
jgi:hypothetical protein